MYARLGNYISAVSGPFHPFGGAIDIIVVEQQDGSFKSSPWYVRFGKFQGVLKSNAAEVKISVNGVEAGFNMYLDARGEAFFLRADDSGDEGCVVSPSDEMVSKLDQSLAVEGGAIEPLSTINTGSGAIVSRANARRSSFFGFIFKGKPMKDECVNVDRRSSLERAEIAADLLEMKWSTNLSSNGEMHEKKSAEKCELTVSVADEKQSSEKSLLPDGCNYVELDDIFSQRFPEQLNNNDTLVIGTKEEGIILHPSEAGGLADMTSLASGKTSQDSVFDDKSFNLNHNVSSEDSSVSRGKKRDVNNSDDSVNNNCLVVASSHEETVDICSFKADIVSDTEAVETREIDPVGVSSEINSGKQTKLTGEILDDLVTKVYNLEDEKEEMKSSVHSQRRENSNLNLNFSCLDTSIDVCIPNIKPQCCNVIAKSPSNDSSNYFNNPHMQECKATEQTLTCLSSSPNIQLLNPETEICSATGFSEKNEETMENVDYSRNQPEIEEETTMEVGSFPFSVSPSSISCVDLIESEKDSTLTMQFKSNEQACEKQLEVVGEKLSLSRDINICQKHDVNSKSGDFMVSSAPVSESLDEIQFSFSDSDGFDGKEVASELSNDDKLIEEKNLILTTAGKENVGDMNYQHDDQPLENISDVMQPYSSPVNIPGNGLIPGAAALSAQSLPILHSEIDIERLSYQYPRSCSLDSNLDISKLDVCKEDNSISTYSQGESWNTLIKTQMRSDADVESVGAQREFPAHDNDESSLCRHLLYEGMGTDASRQAFDAEKEHIFKPLELLPIEGVELCDKANEKNSSTTSGGSWSLWPFSLRRPSPISTKEASTENACDKDVDSFRSKRNLIAENLLKKVKMVRCLTPTSEELASLNLKEGCNVITFSFLTPMLGLQQVDARIYIWKWNTRIVISDVDGTITKSDVLGQFMPMVGVDWSQSGVTHLFTAIKENGYQLLFLSARAISQAHLTRRFLFSLKQDGKALPDGPVVISPDGLFPSLFREVVRRAPHEFKISCLEAIKALFPPDCNPFYAGFGNRDTDEISYLKVGIPLGKIFIINPKGQVVVNRQVDTRSYTSLHELVNDMFPPVNSTEQESYNSWNYWKMPLPEIDL